MIYVVSESIMTTDQKSAARKIQTMEEAFKAMLAQITKEAPLEDRRFTISIRSEPAWSNK